MHHDHIVFLATQGASGVGLGYFQEIGPLDVNLQPRNSTWLQKADLIFVVRQGSEIVQFIVPFLLFISLLSPCVY